MVERVIELRDPRQGSLVCFRAAAEMIDEIADRGELKRGAIDGEQAEVMPSTGGKVLIEKGDLLAVQFHEGLMLEFLTRLTERAGRDDLIRTLGTMDGLEKGVQFDLQRAF